MEKNIKKFNLMQFLLLLFMIFPVLTHAVIAPNNFMELINIIVDLISATLPVLVLLALIYFLWGLTQYLRNTGENKDEAIQMMTNGIIGFFVMVSVWGLVGLLSVTFGTDSHIPDGVESYNYEEDYWESDN